MILSKVICKLTELYTLAAHIGAHRRYAQGVMDLPHARQHNEWARLGKTMSHALELIDTSDQPANFSTDRAVIEKCLKHIHEHLPAPIVA